eukprot:TRINITY_DN7260_c0_g3_i1.p1 TRINITY_DN7260_c0_g3~~TRINITY_DN7260_c0_g3_i1.p1  ORF type:complete len:141 (-),score=50.40 TRINITY_DN7260_c0_g3_i1:135-557(-)
MAEKEVIEQISKILHSKPWVREFQTDLVPSSVSYEDFWKRYFFRVFKMHSEDARRAALLKRVGTNDEDDFNWDASDELSSSSTTTTTPSSTTSSSSPSIPTHPSLHNDNNNDSDQTNSSSSSSSCLCMVSLQHCLFYINR